MTSSVADGAAISRDEMVSRVRELDPVSAGRAVRDDREAASARGELRQPQRGGPADIVRPKLYD
jgi:hypothetical protein